MKSNASHQHSNQSMRISFGIIFVVIGLLLAFVGFNSFIERGARDYWISVRGCWRCVCA
jgi:hypothetical protein